MSSSGHRAPLGAVRRASRGRCTGSRLRSCAVRGVRRPPRTVAVLGFPPALVTAVRPFRRRLGTRRRSTALKRTPRVGPDDCCTRRWRSPRRQRRGDTHADGWAGRRGAGAGARRHAHRRQPPRHLPPAPAAAGRRPAEPGPAGMSATPAPALVRRPGLQLGRVPPRAVEARHQAGDRPTRDRPRIRTGHKVRWVVEPRLRMAAPVQGPTHPIRATRQSPPGPARPGLQHQSASAVSGPHSKTISQLPPTLVPGS